MKIWIKLFLKKGSSLQSIKEHLDKGHLDYSEGWLEIESSLTGIYFWHLIQIKKKFFFQKGHFLTKRPVPGRFIFLK